MSSNPHASFPLFPPSPSHTNSTTSSWTQPNPASTASYAHTQSTPSNGTSRSDSLTSFASSASFPLSPDVQVNIPTPAKAEAFDFGAIGPAKRVRQFGQGWSTTSPGRAGGKAERGVQIRVDDSLQTPPMTASFLDDKDTPVAPARFRTPSLPILPSQGILRNTLGLNTGADHMPTLDSRTLSQHQQFYTGQSSIPVDRPHIHDLFTPVRPQRPDANISNQYAPMPAAWTPSLAHHQSVPNLDQMPRRRGSVRFSDELLAYEDEEDVEMVSRPRVFSTPSAETKRRNVYIHSLPPPVKEHTLREYAEVFGRVLSMRVALDEGRGMDRYDNRRHAFVMFETNDQAGAFMAGIRSKGLPCEYAKEDWQTEYKAREDRFSSNVYVVGLPLEWSKEEVEDYMTQFGRVASLRLLEDKEGHRRGPVLIRFDSRPQAERAIQILNGQSHPVTGERLQARIADSDGQKNYKKLRTSTSADLLLDDRNIPNPDDTDDVQYLLTVRDTYARQLQLLNAQITAAAECSTPTTPRRFQSAVHPFAGPSYRHNLPTPPNSAEFSIPTHSSPAYTSPQAWRHRKLSTSGPHDPRFEGSNPHSPMTPADEYTFAPNPSGSSTEPRPPNPNATPWTPSQTQSFLYRPAPSLAEVGLHHAKSTPELGREKAAKLLWPN